MSNIVLSIKKIIKMPLFIIAYIIYFIFFKKKKIICVEETPLHYDNSEYVLKKLMKLCDKKRTLFIIISMDYVSKKQILHRGKNFRYTNFYANILNRTLIKYSNAIISSNVFIYKKRYNQFTFYLNHGTPIKDVSNYYYCKEYIDYCLSPSRELSNYICDQFHFEKNQSVILGYPRNDSFFRNQIDILSLFSLPKNAKIISWLPTFRKSERGFEKNGLEIIENKDSLSKLTSFLAKRNLYLLVKCHFHTKSHISIDHNKNIINLTNDFLEYNHLQLYDVIAATSALLTDYSSIYFDFLLANKPIGLIWNDIAEYKASFGFGEGIDEYLSGGEIINNFDELLMFLENVSKGIDKKQLTRNEIKNRCNDYLDGNSSERVAQFILDNID